MRLLTGSAPFLAAGLALAGSSAGYVDGPPPGHTGGFGEPSCHACHWESPVNSPGGSLSVTGLPERYSPGERYRLTITLTRPGLLRGGFQLAIRFADGEREGAQAGALAAVNESTAVVEEGGLQYAQHQRAGTTPVSPDTARWQIDWTAPDRPAGNVALHVAANAANDDNSDLGDFIYLLHASAAPDADD